jgi:hypothetical protein
VLAGTSSSTTVIRDLILEQVDDKGTLWRLLFLFPNYIQTPSETLAKEFDVKLFLQCGRFFYNLSFSVGIRLVENFQTEQDNETYTGIFFGHIDIQIL